ncbi:hypothetical protein [Absidia glauca]|uniref:Uncharacterized protein n=1 Tax=Absidia glauca TaxID=4829 RepID=A0A163LNP7_ABSGL|nr:hypothetical protein [Absidia glauca]
MSFIDLAVDTITQQSTGPVSPFADECPATITCPRSDFEVFVEPLSAFENHQEAPNNPCAKSYLTPFDSNDNLY